MPAGQHRRERRRRRHAEDGRRPHAANRCGRRCRSRGAACSRPKHVAALSDAARRAFMAYQAIVAGARGLAFFGGHLRSRCGPPTSRSGWNWTFWDTFSARLLRSSRSTAVAPALVAPAATVSVSASAADIELTARQRPAGFYRTRGPAWPRRRAGSRSRACRRESGPGEVLFEYANEAFRRVAVVVDVPRLARPSRRARVSLQALIRTLLPWRR